MLADLLLGGLGYERISTKIPVWREVAALTGTGGGL